MANEDRSGDIEHPGGAAIADRIDSGDGIEPFPTDGIVDGDGTPDNPRDPAAATGKRGRGRPRKDGGTASSTSGHQGTGSGEKVGKKPTKLDVDLFARQLKGWHLMAAQFFKNPLLAIEDGEALSLAAALKDVMALHSINVSPSTLAYLKLIGAVGMIYGPRVGLMMAAMKAEKAQKKNVFDAATGHPVQ